MPFPTSPPQQKPPPQIHPQVTPQGQIPQAPSYTDLDEKMAKFSLSSQSIPTEPVNYQVDSPDPPVTYQQKQKFEEIFKSFDQIQNGQKRPLPPQQQPQQVNQESDEGILTKYIDHI